VAKKILKIKTAGYIFYMLRKNSNLSRS